MNIRDFSAHFSIYIFTKNVNSGSILKAQLSDVKYDAHFFQSQLELLNYARNSIPHLIVFDSAALETSLNQFVSDCSSISEEIRFIAISLSKDFDLLSKYGEYGFLDIITTEGTYFENRVLWSVDQACEKIYLNLQNQQLYTDLKKNLKLLKDFEEKSNSEKISVTQRINTYSSCSSKEDFIQELLKVNSEVPIVFFKYLSSVRSFMAVQSVSMSSERIQGVGVQLSASEASEMNQQIILGLLPQSFLNVLQESFNFEQPLSFPIFYKDQLEGVFVFPAIKDKTVSQKLYEELSLFKLNYTNFMMERRLDSLEVLDSVTELFNLAYYEKKLSEEFERSKRTKQPLALLKISIDEFFEIENSYGELVRDQIIKSVAAILKKTGRPHDISARTFANEFSVLLPHCSKKGAAVRAERIRKIVETAQLLENGIRLSVSIGVSVFPNSSNSEKELDLSASKSLKFVFERGGNKICIYKAADDFKPQFEVSVE